MASLSRLIGGAAGPPLFPIPALLRCHLFSLFLHFVVSICYTLCYTGCMESIKLTVKVEKYSWGTLRVISNGARTCVIHPGDWDYIQAHGQGGVNFLDEQIAEARREADRSNH